ncbi:unnamed protein product [Owenia fusiformis]|uniref:Uncharacterized protein n=1 Tax=Owenia fusiformis TaxID=6347 RepID=A0A8J1Y2X0_OWEFU|nr:unnamed protein product [Owenia fusiformis]
MAEYFLCLTAGGGVPLFYRSKEDSKQLSFPIIGSLNGVHMFANTHDVDLQSASTDNTHLVWKVFHNSLTLILVREKEGSHGTVFLKQHMELLFQAMVLLYGLEDLMNIKNNERFKREIKVCFNLLDNLLYRSPHYNVSYMADITLTVDTIHVPENAILQNYLESFVQTADSPYGCLLVLGKVAVATTKWWDLTANELVLLSMLVNTLPRCSSRDIPVFLPHGSPKVPHRLLTFQLVQGVEVCVICGPSPSLAELEREVERFWRNSYDCLAAVSRAIPRNFPSTINLDQNILGFALLNTETHRCLCTVQPSTQENTTQGNIPSTAKRKALLRSFYQYTWESFLNQTNQSEQDNQGADATVQTPTNHSALDIYLCSTSHKCYALTINHYSLFILYSTNIPTYALKSVSRQTFDILTKEKSIIL